MKEKDDGIFFSNRRKEEKTKEKKTIKMKEEDDGAFFSSKRKEEKNTRKKKTIEKKKNAKKGRSLPF